MSTFRFIGKIPLGSGHYNLRYLEVLDDGQIDLRDTFDRSLALSAVSHMVTPLRYALEDAMRSYQLHKFGPDSVENWYRQRDSVLEALRKYSLPGIEWETYKES